MSYAYGTGANANYSGRVLVYPNQVPFDTDILRSNQYRMVDVSLLAQTILGKPTTFGGSYPNYSSGICTQNGTPNMSVNIGVCALYELQEMEQSAYGNLGPLATPMIYKQAANMLTLNTITDLGFSITAPVTVGQSQYYLIQGTFENNQQVNTVTRPYYNASNPQAPTYEAAADTEIDNILFSLVPGTPSSTPAIPTPTGSAIGMFVILVAHTDTTILNAAISAYSPDFINETLPQKISEATGNTLYAPISVANFLVPTGAIIDFGGTVAPIGYLNCDGSAISQTTYAALYAAIGTTWNTGGEGAGNFRLPSLSRHTTIGSGGSGTGIIGNAVGNTGGEEAHTQTVPEIATHTPTTASVSIAGYTTVGSIDIGGAPGNGLGQSGGTTRNLTLTVTDSTITLNSIGSSTPMNVIQPSAVVMKCIKY